MSERRRRRRIPVAPVMEARLSAKGASLSSNYELIEARIVNRLRRVPGVARVELGDGGLKLSYPPEKPGKKKIKETVEG